MPKPIAIQIRKLVNKCSVLELFATSKSVTSIIALRDLTKRLEWDLTLLLSALGLREARTSPPELKGIPGSRYERKEYRVNYRCWACRNFGEICINTFLNRLACELFKPNRIISKYPARVGVLKKSKGNQPAKLKPPVIPKFNHHYPTCRVCQRIANSDVNDKAERQLKHFDKSRLKKRRKLAVYFAFYGVRFREDYIYDWE